MWNWLDNFKIWADNVPWPTVTSSADLGKWGCVVKVKDVYFSIPNRNATNENSLMASLEIQVVIFKTETSLNSPHIGVLA